MKKLIITVSRRTDIPAFYSNWFRKRLEAGYVFYPNPFSHKPVYVDLSPSAVKAFVFWTRNPKPLFKHLDYIDDKYYKRHYLHFTINGYPKIFEKKSPDINYAISLAEYLAKRYGKNYVQWRFDPIIISDITNKNFILNKFRYIAERLNGIITRCYFSFVDLYLKTRRNLNIISKKSGIKIYDVSLNEQVDLTKTLLNIARENNIKLYACTEDNLLNYIPELNKAHCVDLELINKYYLGEDLYKYKISPTRKECGCYESKDIGYYDSCPFGCIYCYAYKNPIKAYKNSKIYLKNNFPLDSFNVFSK